jgi:hypothetical protein
MQAGIRDCPNSHGAMELKRFTDTKSFRGEEIIFAGEYYVCPVCGLEAGTIELTMAIQRATYHAYLRKIGVLQD